MPSAWGSCGNGRCVAGQLGKSAGSAPRVRCGVGDHVVVGQQQHPGAVPVRVRGHHAGGHGLQRIRRSRRSERPGECEVATAERTEVDAVVGGAARRLGHDDDVVVGHHHGLRVVRAIRVGVVPLLSRCGGVARRRLDEGEHRHRIPPFGVVADVPDVEASTWAELLRARRPGQRFGIAGIEPVDPHLGSGPAGPPVDRRDHLGAGGVVDHPVRARDRVRPGQAAGLGTDAGQRDRVGHGRPHRPGRRRARRLHCPGGGAGCLRRRGRRLSRRTGGMVGEVVDRVVGAVDCGDECVDDEVDDKVDGGVGSNPVDGDAGAD